eukprot:2435075-Prymnesium_polylepis.2
MPPMKRQTKRTCAPAAMPASNLRLWGLHARIATRNAIEMISAASKRRNCCSAEMSNSQPVRTVRCRSEATCEQKIERVAFALRVVMLRLVSSNGGSYLPPVVGGLIVSMQEGSSAQQRSSRGTT